MTPTVDAQLDESWFLQGRIIPPSCSHGDGCILHLQTRSHSWAKKHFHTARLGINNDTGVELAMSMLIPIADDVIRDSLDSGEREQEVEYLAMAKLYKPEGSIAFPTITGLTIIIHNNNLASFFGPSEKCRDCRVQASVDTILISEIPELKGFDPMMEMTGERSH